MKGKKGVRREKVSGTFFLHNALQSKEEIENIHDAIKKSRPYGSEQWVAKAVGKFGLENTMRKRGRPKKDT